MKSRLILLSPLMVLVVAALWAQQGDRAGEVQAPLASHWVIPPAPVLTPAEQAKTFKVAPGFRAELVAAEPLVQDPITMTFGPDGRLWVVEMTGYMRDLEGTGEKDPIGNIVVLTDTNGDGRMDHRQVFLDGLILPRAIALIDGGVLYGEPPNLWFARDTNGDGVADTKEVVVNNYGGPGNVEHLPNGLMWAMDNWIYNAKHNVRFRYEGNGRFSEEMTIARGQWGITQDDTGRLYHNSNSDPLRFDPVPSEYLKRNPAFPAGGTNIQIVPATLRVWPNRITTGINRGYKTLDPDGRMYAVTAACGPVIYRGGLFPSEFNGDAFIAEPTGHLIKRIKLANKDGGVLGANAYEGTEFLTSTDERFRPVNLFNGPDGALWVVDMYRGLIQDKLYVTSYLRKQVEERGLAAPIGLGRIWRIVPDNAPPANFNVSLATAAPIELVRWLGDENGWTRDTAQRLLVEKRHAAQTPAVAAALRDFVRRAENPLGRLHALWTLDGSKALDRATVRAALDDRDVRVVAAAVRLADSFHREPGGAPDLAARVIELAASRTEPELRLQLALSLGEIRTVAADEALRALVVAAGDQTYLADAVVSGIAGREAALVAALATNAEAAVRAGPVVRFATSAVLRHADAAAIDRVLGLAAETGTPEWARFAMLEGVRHFLPKSPDGRLFPGTLPAEPKPLLAIAARSGTPEAVLAQELAAQIKWPGKPAGSSAAMRPLAAAEEILFEKGKAQFLTLCAACHQPSGQGLPGLAPPLLYSRWVLGDPRILARIILNGKVQQNMVMPGWKTLLDDETIAGVLTFVRRSWGHDADPVTVATVAEARRSATAREDPWTDTELQALVQTLGAPAK